MSDSTVVHRATDTTIINRATAATVVHRTDGTTIVTSATTGPQGPPGTGGVELPQSSGATWTVPLPPEFATRRPTVTLYDPAGVLFLSDVVVTAGVAVVTHHAPTAGSVVLT